MKYDGVGKRLGNATHTDSYDFSAGRTPELFERVGDMSTLLYNALRRFVLFFRLIPYEALFCDMSQ